MKGNLRKLDDLAKLETGGRTPLLNPNRQCVLKPGKLDRYLCDEQKVIKLYPRPNPVLTQFPPQISNVDTLGSGVKVEVKPGAPVSLLARNQFAEKWPAIYRVQS